MPRHKHTHAQRVYLATQGEAVTHSTARDREPHLKDYTLSPEFLALINALTEKYAGSNADLIKKAVAWLIIALQIHQSGGGPNAAFIGVCNAGIDPALKANLGAFFFGSGYQRKKNTGFDWHPPSLQGLAWDVRPNDLWGHTELALSKDALANGLRV